MRALGRARARMCWTLELARTLVLHSPASDEEGSAARAAKELPKLLKIGDHLGRACVRAM